jgi:HAD superfamily hydrolase (TIGR01509 family)
MKNYFFDLDGVLIDACDWHYESLNLALQKYCNFIINYPEHLERFNGLPTRKKLEMLNIDLKMHQKIIDSKNEAFNNILLSNCKPNQEKIDLFKHLKSKDGKIACVSNSIKTTVEAVLNQLGILQFFDLIVSNQDVTLNKPDPFPYDFAYETLGCDPKESMAVEDSEVGILSACRSKIGVIWKVKNASEVNLINYKKVFGE